MNAWLLTQLARERHTALHDDAARRRLAHLIHPPSMVRVRVAYAMIAFGHAVLAAGLRLADEVP